MKAIYILMALLSFACRTTAPGTRDRSAPYAAAAEKKIPKLTRVELFGGKDGNAYFFRIDIEQKSLDASWTSVDQGKPLEKEATVALTDAQIVAVKKGLLAMKELPEASACDSTTENSPTLMIGDADEDLQFEAVARGDNRCVGPYVDLEGYTKLQAEIESWLPESAKKLKQPSV